MSYTGSVPDAERPVDWRDSGLCRRKGEDAEDWFAVGGGMEAVAARNHAKAVCCRCPVLEACGRWALERREPAGIWGGLDEKERRVVLRRRGIRLPDIEDDGPAPARTLHTIWEARAAATGDGHCTWRGGQPITFQQQHYTPHQVAFAVSRGRPWVGQVLPTCSRAGCILPGHIADQQEREERSRVTAVTA